MSGIIMPSTNVVHPRTNTFQVFLCNWSWWWSKNQNTQTRAKLTSAEWEEEINNSSFDSACSVSCWPMKTLESRVLEKSDSKQSFSLFSVAALCKNCCFLFCIANFASAFGAEKTKFFVAAVHHKMCISWNTVPENGFRSRHDYLNDIPRAHKVVSFFLLFSPSELSRKCCLTHTILFD